MERYKIFKAVALLLTFSILQVYVMANPAGTNASAGSPLYGHLLVTGNSTVLLNGNSANSGTTILSGSQLQTPQGVKASVQLGAAGRLDISPETNLTLTFSKDSVDVNVISGNAHLTTNAGVKGTVTMPDGTTGEPSSNPLPRMTNGKKAAAIIIPIVIVVTILVIVLNDDDES
jgi:hypothetical protein